MLLLQLMHTEVLHLSAKVQRESRARQALLRLVEFTQVPAIVSQSSIDHSFKFHFAAVLSLQLLLEQELALAVLSLRFM